MTHCTLETDLRTLTDLELLSRTERLARVERAATIRLLHHLNEIARRKLYLELGCSSLYDYCVRGSATPAPRPAGASGRRAASASTRTCWLFWKAAISIWGPSI